MQDRRVRSALRRSRKAAAGGSSRILLSYLGEATMYWAPPSAVVRHGDLTENEKKDHVAKLLEHGRLRGGPRKRVTRATWQALLQAEKEGDGPNWRAAAFCFVLNRLSSHRRGMGILTRVLLPPRGQVGGARAARS